jgi:homoserine kinase type II
MNRQQTQALCAHFSLGSLRALEIAGGTRNISYVAQTESGAWFLRQRHPAYCAPERIRFDHAAGRYLAERGTPTLLPRPGADGATWWQADGAVWEVFPFAAGRHLHDGDRADAEALGSALALWHRAGQDFPLRYEKLTARGETDPDRLLVRTEEIARESPEAVGILAAYRATLTRAAHALPSTLYTALPQTLIHGDIQPANLLVDQGRLRAFVDLDWCGWQARLYDLSFAILFCCAGHETPLDGGDIRSLTQPPHLEAEVTAAFLHAYAQEAPPLTAEEREALRPQLLLTWCHTRLDGAMKVPPAERAAFLLRPPDLTDPAWPPLE